MKAVKMPKRLKINELTPASSIVLNAILTLFALACLLPVILAYSISFSSETSILQHGYGLIPKELSMAAYTFYLKSGEQVIQSYLVSITVTVVGTISSVLVTAMFAYSLSRRNFAYRNAFSFIAFFTMLFSGGLVSSYIINANVLHLSNTIFALILPYTVGAFNVIILRTFFSTSIPEAIYDSARIDGAGEIRTFITIAVPLGKPGLATIGLFSVISYWNDWFLGLLYITSPKLVSIQYMLYKTQNSLEFIKANSKYASSAAGVDLIMNMPNESGRMALVVIVMTPVLFCYPFFQKYFIRGLTVGSVKG